ncbi:MAG: hypothetical protein NZ108_10295, partial [Bacteroidia bacterium]|nr:hypothetical protein [Bacteroidia bacterium]
LNAPPYPLTWLNQTSPQWNTVPPGVVQMLNKTYTVTDAGFESFNIEWDVWEEEGSDECNWNPGDDARVQVTTNVNWRSSPPNTWNQLDIPLRASTSTGDRTKNWTAWIRYRWNIGPPVITAQPSLSPAGRCIGEPTQNICVQANNDTYYQWQVGIGNDCATASWSDIAGATCNCYSVPQTPGTRFYRVRVFNRSGSGSTVNSMNPTGSRYQEVISNCVPVTYFNFTPTITSSAGCPATIVPGSTHSFSIPVVPGASSYLWTVTPSLGVTISNPTSNSTNITFPTTQGTYTVRIIVGEPCVGSTEATCIITVPSADCNNVYVTPGGSATGAGTVDDPVNIERAIQLVNDPARTQLNIRILGGNSYNHGGGIVLTKNNTTIDGGWEIVSGEWRKSNAVSRAVINISPGDESSTISGKSVVY